MKKVSLIFAAILAAISLSAAEPEAKTTEQKVDPRDKHSNIYEKVPLEGKYVGYVGIELLTPSFFGGGGVDYGVTTSHGAMITNRIFLGGGAGYMQDFNNSIGLFPVFADFRYFFQSKYQRRIYPHIGARAGAVIPTEGKVGYMVQLGLGVRIPFSENFAMNVEVGPQYATKYERDTEDKYVSIGKPFVSNGDFFSFFFRVNFEF